MGRYYGPGVDNQPNITFSNQAALGRFVVVQKIFPGVINIAEIYVISDKIGDYNSGLRTYVY